LTFDQFWQTFIDNLIASSWLERLAVVAGIASVWFSRKENILVYPVGLINTIIYIWISYQYHLPGEASVNFYYTIMSLYGWYMWARKNQQQEKVLHITYSDRSMWQYQVLFFTGIYIAYYLCLTFLQKHFFEGAIPWADSLATATAFTGMWLMTRKKVESWYWWIATNIASIPLYFVKGLALTSVYYLVLLIMAISGLLEWKKRAIHASRQAKQNHA
jgi:nicotinamide mononucleotide transporter